ncbi:MAG: hypothetical protein PW786_00510 [Arachidicoccus sp.]|nr:hypothetical protein [Arachidicoccus sp.]
MNKYLKQGKIIIAAAIIALSFSACYVEEPVGYGYGYDGHYYHHHHYRPRPYYYR